MNFHNGPASPLPIPHEPWQDLKSRSNLFHLITHAYSIALFFFFFFLINNGIVLIKSPGKPGVYMENSTSNT